MLAGASLTVLSQSHWFQLWNMVKGPVNRKKRLLAAFVLLRRRKRKKKQAGQRRNYRSCARDEFRMKSNRLLEQMMAWKHRDKKWIQNVGMTYPTFKLLAQKIDHHGLLARKRKDGASIVERLLTVLNLFRYGKHLRDQEVQVGKAHNTIGRWRKDVCKALMQLLDELVQLPVEEQDLKDNANGFSRFKRSRMINCIGAIDGTHIRIASSDMAYRNYKKYNSINCQVICDHMFYIRHVMAGAPGCYSDKTMYTASGIDKWIKYIRTQNVLDIDGVPVGYYICADGIYVGYGPGIMIPHERKYKPLDQAQKDFDFFHSSCRMVIEQCFGILKARWSILTNCAKLRYKAKIVTDIFLSCCVLHNWCLLHSEVWPREDELPDGHHREYANFSTCGSMPTGDTVFPNLMAEAQRNALSMALQEAHMEDA